MALRPANLTIALAAGFLIAGCGSSSSKSTTAKSTGGKHAATPKPHKRRAAALEASGTLALPAARSGIAASSYGGRIVTSGGLSSAGVSTDAVFAVNSGGGSSNLATLPSPVHDAASAVIGDRLLLFGGGQSEGSNRILQVQPGAPHLIGTLPQALSDLTANTIGSTAYVAGGWNGTDTNRDIYAITAGGSVTTAGHIGLGVRYPAAGTLDGKLIIAGGETTAGTPTADAWSFDPGTGTVKRLPDLPAPTDHTSGIALDGSFYVLGGLREGTFTNVILSWTPGESHWREAGHLRGDVADGAAVLFGPGIALVGGRDAAGQRPTIDLLRPR